MRKILLLIPMIGFCLVSYAQVSYPPLREENVDFSTITDDNYLMYKLSTTKPAAIKTEIEEKFILKNFGWDKILVNNSKQSYQMGTLLIDSLNLREPLSDENPNYIYYHAQINDSLLPLMMRTKCSFPMFKLRDMSSSINAITNLHNLSLIVVPKLTDSNKRALKLGRKCEITTKLLLETNETDFTFAFELLGCQFSDIQSGTVELMIGNFTEPEKCLIKKSDVGKKVRFHSRDFEVLAFDNGVLHLKYMKRFKDTFVNYKYIGNINGEKFNIICPRSTILYAAYDKYREKPKFDYEAFKKFDTPKGAVRLDVKQLEYDVAIFNFGYDIDSLNIYLEKSLVPTMLKSVISVKKEGENYSFIPIVNQTPTLLSTEIRERIIETVRSYFRQNVKYPQQAQDNGIQGIVSFKFTINTDGTVPNIEILRSDHSLFSDAVIRVARQAKIKSLKLDEPIRRAVMSLQFQL